MKFLYKLISTWWAFGLIKKIPGTVGSLAAYPIVPLILYNKVLGAIIILFLLLLGLWSTNNYIKYYQTLSDPKEVVIDEVVGQLLTIFLISDFLGQTVDYPLLVLCFFSFRFFDVVKIWPVNLINKNIGGSLGIMLDDIVAAVLACTFIRTFYYLLSSSVFIK
ncbi:MAG: phosphatidylglycerophosphatase A [Wolbachia endosymbiont of Menacanthus eurysternus]|nr:MAG: phosphatidylglycerophosphatase A [Wolbachia endosymbiont of Menacanthus eurysternus]